MKKLIVVVGPTAVGKTTVAIQLAERFGCEIISSDARQFYREMDIGTAKPSKEELERVTHHFINSLSVHDHYTVADFEADAIDRITKLHNTTDTVIMAGGSGLFVRAVCEGLDHIPDIKPGIREALIDECQEQGQEALLSELKTTDPEYYSKVDRQNPQRIIRALEVVRSTGKPFSSFRSSGNKQRPFSIIKIGLYMDRERLYQRINDRMDAMLKEGLKEEAESLYKHKTLNALQTVGYSEIFAYLDGNYDWEECVRLLKRNSRRYAKRQLTWFKRDQEVRWFDVEKTGIEDIVRAIETGNELQS